MAKYRNTELDLDNYQYWIQKDEIHRVQKAEQEEFSVGQEIDLVALTKRAYGTKWYFGFLNESMDEEPEDCAGNVVVATVTGKGKDSVHLEYLRRQANWRGAIVADENGFERQYCAQDSPTGVAWDVPAYFQDKFILRGKLKEACKEAGFSVDYSIRQTDSDVALEIRIGKVVLSADFYKKKEYFYGDVRVLGWKIAEEQGETTLLVQLRATICYPRNYLGEDYNPYSDCDSSFGYDDFE